MGTTGVVKADSPLNRRAILKGELVRTAGANPWLPFMGTTFSAVIVLGGSAGAGRGHKVVKDYDGVLEGRVVTGSDTIVGTGENKRKFYNETFMEEYATSVANGTRFDLVNIGVDDPTNNKQHSQSITQLAQVMNSKIIPQQIYDTFPGLYLVPKATGSSVDTPTNIVHHTGGAVSIADMEAFGAIATNGYGFPDDVDKTIMPLSPQGASPEDVGTPCDNKYYWHIDPDVALLVRQNPLFISTMSEAEGRGLNNRAISGKIGTIGGVIDVVVHRLFVGITPATTNGFNSIDQRITLPGMRQLDTVTGLWTGQVGFSRGNNRTARTYITGSSSMSYNKGMAPVYGLQESNDFSRKSESAVMWWASMSLITLISEHEDNAGATLADTQGVIIIDVDLF